MKTSLLFIGFTGAMMLITLGLTQESVNALVVSGLMLVICAATIAHG